MSADWVRLRDGIASWLDAEIAAERDPAVRSMLARQRTAILDHVELITLRKFLAQEQAERAEQADHELVPINDRRVVRVNGRAH